MDTSSDRSVIIPPEVVALLPVGGNDDESLQSAETVLRLGRIESPVLPGLPFELTVNAWAALTNRATLRKLHSFMFMEPWSRAVSSLDEGDVVEMRRLVEHLVESWNSSNPGPSDSEPMAFHDETTAQRLMVLHAVAARLWGSDTPSSLVTRIEGDRKLLSSDAFYAGLNNHGMFQDIALLVDAVMTRRSDLSSLSIEYQAQVSLAVRRLLDYVKIAFTDEGVHIEHAPSYHLMVVHQLRKVRDLLVELEALGFEFDDTTLINEVLQKGARYLTHMIGPDGFFPLFSDTTRVRLDRPENILTLGSSDFEFAATMGARGTRPGENAVCFANSGYGIYRSDWGTPDALYVLFTAAYNGGYHKHSDDLSVIVIAGGRPVLSEAGPNGYDYDDPNTAYAYSSFAHNTLIVDGRGLPRHDGNLESTWLEDAGTTTTKLDALGTTTRFDGVRFQRRVCCSEDSGTTVKVSDRISSDEGHEYRLIWHLGAGLTPEVHGDHLEIMDEDGVRVAELSFTTREPFEIITHSPSATNTRLNRWFPRMGQSAQAWTIETVFFARDVELVTHIRTSEFFVKERKSASAPVDIRWSTWYGSRAVRYAIEDRESEGPLTVIFSAMSKEGDFTFNYRRSLQGSPGPKMYILDNWGDQGAYYYSHSRDTSIFESVRSAITNEMMALGRNPSDLVTIGSSKGGTAALIHGLSLGAGLVLVGEPQILIGTFTENAHPNVLKYMSGGISPGDIAWADDIVARQMKNSVGDTRCVVLVGRKDHHWRGHATQGELLAAQHDVSWDTVSIPGTTHSQLGPVYSGFMRGFVDSLSSSSTAASLFRVSPDTICCYVNARNDEAVAVRLYRGNEVVHEANYQSGRVFEWVGLSSGVYRARVFVRPAGALHSSAFTLPRVRL